MDQTDLQRLIDGGVHDPDDTDFENLATGHVTVSSLRRDDTAARSS